jgi:hypothetical protein
MTQAQALATTPSNVTTLARPAAEGELTVEDLIAQVRKVQEVMQALMKDGEHYGVIPGTKSKPTLLKPGAEKLCLLFRLDPEYEVMEQTRDGDHLTIMVRCVLFHSPTGQRRGSGLGSCSTRESKYAYRKGDRKCPKCDKETIRKSKDSGWYCWRKIDGCGATFRDGDQSIEGQSVGRVANPDVPDTYNTVLKMGTKRALIAAVLNVTAASDIFTQDLEDLPSAGEEHAPQASRPTRAGAPSVAEEIMGDEEPEFHGGPPGVDGPLSFGSLEKRLADIEKTITYAKSYDDVVRARAELGSRGKPSQLTRDMQEAGPTRRILSGPEFKAISKIWARCDRQLAKLEEKHKPDAVDSFTDPPEDEEPPSPEDDGRA